MSQSMRRMLLSRDVDCVRWPASIRNVARTSADAPGFAVGRIQGIAPYLRPVCRCGSILLLSVRRKHYAGARTVRAQENTSELSYLYQKEQDITRKNGFLGDSKEAYDKIVFTWVPPVVVLCHQMKRRLDSESTSVSTECCGCLGGCSGPEISGGRRRHG